MTRQEILDFIEKVKCDDSEEDVPTCPAKLDLCIQMLQRIADEMASMTLPVGSFMVPVERLRQALLPGKPPRLGEKK